MLSRPSLWPTAVRQWWRLAPSRWWRRPPFLPVPTREYLRFRLVTQYGDTRTPPDGDDVVSYRAPIAAGMLGCRAGETATLDLPQGAVEVIVQSVTQVVETTVE